MPAMWICKFSIYIVVGCSDMTLKKLHVLLKSRMLQPIGRMERISVRGECVNYPHKMFTFSAAFHVFSYLLKQSKEKCCARAVCMHGLELNRCKWLKRGSLLERRRGK